MKKEVRLTIKQFGYLTVFRNGELCFVQLEQALADPTESVALSRMKQRDEDGATILDRASAILSLNGGTTFSVKSGWLTNMSVKTPRSKVSNATSNVRGSATSLPWTKYRSNARVADSPNKIFESTGFNHERSPRPKAQPNDYDLQIAPQDALSRTLARKITK